MKLKSLLICGIFSSFLYLATDITASVIWSEYRYSSQTISELIAISAPTRAFVTISFMVYSLLIYSFGAGVWLSANEKMSLKFAAVLIVGKEVLGLAVTLFFPIHLRGVATGYTDVLHGILTAIGVFLFMFPAMISGSIAFKGVFRVYSIVTMLLFVYFGVKAGTMQPELAANLPTPMMGIWERINVYGYLIWIVFFALKLLKLNPKVQSITE
jgi:hypothetical protein